MHAFWCGYQSTLMQPGRFKSDLRSAFNLGFNDFRFSKPYIRVTNVRVRNPIRWGCWQFTYVCCHMNHCYQQHVHRARCTLKTTPPILRQVEKKWPVLKVLTVKVQNSEKHFLLSCHHLKSLLVTDRGQKMAKLNFQYFAVNPLRTIDAFSRQLTPPLCCLFLHLTYTLEPHIGSVYLSSLSTPAHAIGDLQLLLCGCQLRIYPFSNQTVLIEKNCYLAYFQKQPITRLFFEVGS